MQIGPVAWSAAVDPGGMEAGPPVPDAEPGVPVVRPDGESEAVEALRDTPVPQFSLKTGTSFEESPLALDR